MSHELKLYDIEYRYNSYDNNTYRFYSLYNGARGGWTTKEKAIAEGEEHRKLLMSLFFGEL